MEKVVKRAGLLALIGGLAALLGACNIIFVTDDPEFGASDLEVNTDYEDEAGFFICNDATTEVTYTFGYEGEVERWTQELREYNAGDEFTGRATLERTVRPENSRATVTEDSVTFRFIIDPFEALEPINSQVSTQQNVVVDTRLQVEATGTDGSTEVLIADLPTKCDLEQ